MVTIVDLEIFLNKSATPTQRMIAYADLVHWVRQGYGFPADKISALGRFVWSCGHTDSWLAVAGATLLGLLAETDHYPEANVWVVNLINKASYWVREALTAFAVEDLA